MPGVSGLFSSANFAVIVELPRVSFLRVTSRALLFASLRLRSEPRSASLAFRNLSIDLSISSISQLNFWDGSSKFLAKPALNSLHQRSHHCTARYQARARKRALRTHTSSQYDPYRAP